MNICRHLSLAGGTLAALAATLPATAQTHPADAAKSYLVTTVAQSAAGTAVSRESLGFRPEGDGYRLFIASADGTTFSSPVSFTPQGVIASDSQDGAITCYNMAMSVLAGVREPADDPAAVFVAFGNSVVRVPLSVRTTRTSGTSRSIELTGVSRGQFTSDADAAQDAGIIITASIDEERGALRAARFDEVHYLGTATHVVGRSTCVVAPAATHAAVARQT